MQGTIKCPICGKPYKWYSMTTADQTACPECVQEAERAVRRKSNEQEERRRRRYFGEPTARRQR